MGYVNESFTDNKLGRLEFARQHDSLESSIFGEKDSVPSHLWWCGPVNNPGSCLTLQFKANRSAVLQQWFAHFFEIKKCFR